MKRLTYVAFLGSLLLTAHARAEGSAQLGTSQRLMATTELYVDVLASGETITWTGAGTLTVRAPGGAVLGVLASGTSLVLGGPGTYGVRTSVDQTGAWDIGVTPSAVGTGRLHSRAWSLDGGSFAASSAANTSVYVLVPGGAVGSTAVVEVRLDGYAGFVYRMLATSTGLSLSPARGTPISGGTLPTGELPIYLNVPEIASRTHVAPAITATGFASGALGCGVVVPGTTTGAFRFDSNVAGTYHVSCDLNEDGVLDRTNAADLLLVGVASVGANAVTWDGHDTTGAPAAPGTYECVIALNVGEVHWIAEDIETSYEGLRMFAVDSGGARSPLAMFWDDARVQANAVTMPNGMISPVRSGPTGVSSGAYSAAAIPWTGSSGNARAWGNFASTSKGNSAWLDTYTSVASAVSGLVMVEIDDGVSDGDGDSLPSYVERCSLGTDPTLSDTDGDGYGDGVEASGGSPIDTDMDGTIDALDLDSDGDGVLDATDAARTDRFVCADADADGCDDCSIGGSADVAADGDDTDGDGLCDAGDDDDDGDTVADEADVDPADPMRCADADADGCDDCAVTGAPTPDDDGPDRDADGACDDGDPVDDRDAGSSGDAGSGAPDAGLVPADASVSLDGAAGDAGAPPASGGCGCSAPRAGGAPWSWIFALAVLAMSGRRRWGRRRAVS